MKTLTLTQRGEILAKAWKNYVTIRRAYCNRKATVQQLAHALALVGVAEVRTGGSCDDSFISARSVMIEHNYYLRDRRVDWMDRSGIIAGPFFTRKAVIKARNKFLRDQRKEAKKALDTL